MFKEIESALMKRHEHLALCGEQLQLEGPHTLMRTRKLNQMVGECSIVSKFDNRLAWHNCETFVESLANNYYD